MGFGPETVCMIILAVFAYRKLAEELEEYEEEEEE